MASTPEVASVAPTKRVAWWKRWLVFGAGAGAAFAVTMALIVGVALWYESRPKPPKPWNTEAIKATFVQARTEGEERTLVFLYAIENTTNTDYLLTDKSEALVMLRWQAQKSLSRDPGWTRIDFPVFVPAKERLRFEFHVPLSYRQGGTPKTGEGLTYEQALALGAKPPSAAGKEGDIFDRLANPYADLGAIPDKKKTGKEGLELSAKELTALSNEMGNLEGFVLFDKANRYQINFPRGW